MAKNFNKTAWLERLERVHYEPTADKDEGGLEQLNLGPALLALTGLNHDREYTLCQEVAQHLLGKVPEPDDADLYED